MPPAHDVVPRLQALQMMRVIAVMLVVLLHGIQVVEGAPAAFDGTIFPSIPNLASFGSSGVDLFFVISGFAMSASIYNPAFYRRLTKRGQGADMIFNTCTVAPNGAPDDTSLLAMKAALRDLRVVVRKSGDHPLRDQMITVLTDARSRIDRINER